MEDVFSPLSHPKITTGFFQKKISDSHVIFHPGKPFWIIVNDMGWKIVKLLNGKNSISDIVRIIQSKFDVVRDVAEKDVWDFLSSISKAGFLENACEKKVERDDTFSTVYMHITNRCNLRCKHCYYPQKSKSNEDELSENAVLGFLDHFYKAGGKQVNLSGGEPLLRRDLVKRILEKSGDANCNILTNGTLMDDEFASFLADYNVSLQVSIDGSTEKVHDSIRGKGAFKAAMKGIEVLQRKGLAERINSCTTIMKQNFKDLKNIIEFARTVGISYVRFIPLLKEGRACRNWSDLHRGISVKKYEEFYNYVFERAKNDYPDMKISSGLCGFVLDPKKFDHRGHWCPIAKNLVIDVQGNVYSCAMLMNEEYKLGNIHLDSIDDLKQSRVHAQLIDALADRRKKIKKCRQCMWRNFCQGGCMGLAQHSSGAIWQSDEFCSYRKNLYEKSMVNIVKGKKPHYYKGETLECM